MYLLKLITWDHLIWVHLDFKMTRVLIINRGEIAKRIDHAAFQMGFETHMIYESGDMGHLRHGVVSHLVDNYLDQQAIIQIAKSNAIDLIHPGYGYLSENDAFAALVESNGLTWVGPKSEILALFGNKFATKSLALKHHIPCLKTTTNIIETQGWQGPIMVKASMGGGGRAMQVAQDFKACLEIADRVRREAQSIFQDESIFFEPYLSSARHIEIQVMADQFGTVRIIGDRDCSIQRRHQKIIEEAPARGLSDAERSAMHSDAKRLVVVSQLTSCATVEFLFDEKTRQHWLMEVNPRIQVEHGVTEAVANIDLVGWQFKIAMGQAIDFKESEMKPVGHAIQARVYAEDPTDAFKPSSGILEVSDMKPMPDVDWHTSLSSGQALSATYDPMIMKVIAYGDAFNTAKNKLIQALGQWHMGGIKTNRDWLVAALSHLDDGIYPNTHWVSQFNPNFDCTSDCLERLSVVMIFLDNMSTQPLLELRPSWHLTGQPWQSSCYKIAGQNIDLHYQWTEHNQIALAHDRIFRCLAWQNEFITISIESNIFKYRVTQVGKKNWVISDDNTSYEVQAYSPSLASVEDNNQKPIVSPMPGKLVSMLVKVGDFVKKNQSMAIIEAMKMHHEIKASQDLVITAAIFQVGAHIPANVPIFQWESQ